MKIKSSMLYAMRLMIDLMDHSNLKEPVRMKDIASRQGISKRYLGQLVVHLKNASLIKSIHGRNGGFILARSPSEIKIGEIFEAMHGPIILLDCIEGEEYCMAASTCMCRKMWMEINEKIRESLYSFSLAEFSEKDAEHSFPAEVAGVFEQFPNQCRSYSECVESIKNSKEGGDRR